MIGKIIKKMIGIRYHYLLQPYLSAPFELGLDGSQSVFKLVLCEGLPAQNTSFEDHSGLVWRPKSSLAWSLCYMCSVCIHGDLLLLNQAGLMHRKAVGETSLQWQQTTMTLLQCSYYHLHQETGFAAKLELGWLCVFEIHLSNPALSNIHFLLLTEWMQGHSVLCVWILFCLCGNSSN